MTIYHQLEELRRENQRLSARIRELEPVRHRQEVGLIKVTEGPHWQVRLVECEEVVIPRYGQSKRYTFYVVHATQKAHERPSLESTGPLVVVRGEPDRADVQAVRTEHIPAVSAASDKVSLPVAEAVFAWTCDALTRGRTLQDILRESEEDRARAARPEGYTGNEPALSAGEGEA